ncbi:thiamine pyrophosphate-binding protein [Ferrimicrobium sp.]|uniref:thiamine pyrophosphate-binding protein n=1 Tax=Ferrimicrobium sp. TaxID=2926050 RepID=UPI0026174528|nr:thiamine pyrophosphate-binding protein [Ferrimicrobium sp.]
MRGAEALVVTLEELGVTHIFTNPGTTELELVQALENHRRIDAVLVAQELVATAAADGYARLHGLGAVLLHLGPGFSNSAAFVHDAKRAQTPMIVIVGEHPKDHMAWDAPLNTDLVAIMSPFCVAVLVANDPATIGLTTKRAGELARSLRGPVGLIAPQDVMASEAGRSDGRETCAIAVDSAAVASNDKLVPARSADRHRPQSLGEEGRPAGLLKEQMGSDPLFLLGSTALSATSQRLAAGIADHFGGRVCTEVFPALMERGRHLPPIARLPYFPDQARSFIGTPSVVILVGAREPIAYFAEPNRLPQLIVAGTPIVELIAPGDPAEGVLLEWARVLGIAGVDGRDALVVRVGDEPSAGAVSADIPNVDTVTTHTTVTELEASDSNEGEAGEHRFDHRHLHPMSDAPGAGEHRSSENQRQEVSGMGTMRGSAALTVDTLGRIFAGSLQSGDIVVDEGRTSSGPMFANAGDAPPHWYVGHPGGAIGGGLGLALGVAVATRRRVRALVADGGALYAPQALLSIAHLGLDVGIVIVVNGGYRILRMEMKSRGIAPISRALTSFDDPTVDYVALALAFGVDGERVTTADELVATLERRSRVHEPFLVVAELAEA